MSFIRHLIYLTITELFTLKTEVNNTIFLTNHALISLGIMFNLRLIYFHTQK